MRPDDTRGDCGDRSATADPSDPVGQPPGSAASDPEVRPLEQQFDRRSLFALRSAVAAHAVAAGLSPHQVYDVTAAAHELAANAVRHGAGHGHLRLWAAGESLYCQVSDDGPVSAGPVPAATAPADPAAASGEARFPTRHGHGLWIVQQVARELSIRHGPAGTIATARFAISPARQPAPDRDGAAAGPRSVAVVMAGDSRSAGPAATPPALDVLVSEGGAWTTVRVEGELDYLSSVDLIMVLGGILTTGKQRIAVDLSNATLCDSSGIRCVLRAGRQFHERGGELVVVYRGPLQDTPGLRELARMIPVLPDLPR